MRRARGLFFFLLCVAGCSGAHSSLDPAGPQAARTSGLYWVFFAVCALVYVVVISLLLIGVFRRSARDFEAETEVLPHEPDKERRLGLIVSTAVGLSVLLLFVLLIADYSTGRRMHEFSQGSNPVSITITGHQWWWEIKYDDSTPSNIFNTANEIHIPTGRPVRVWLQSADVIHSFWVPNLQGKKDLIPNHGTSLWLQADKEGTFYGQCAEFCGNEHALMRITVIAESQDKFNLWLAAARTPAGEPITDRQKKGRDVFLSSSCVMCHAISGTTAGARFGPDLTHVASRQTLAAGTVPNMPGHLAGWIIDPQRVKPGVRMPQNTLRPEDLTVLMDFLTSLK